MNYRTCKNWIVLAVAISSVAGLQAANAQQTPPAATEGVEALKLQAVDLGPEIEGMQGRQLRLRKLTIEPGGQIALHSHENRPAVAYVLQGATTVTFGDGQVKRFAVGDSIAANRNTTHWHRNEGSEPAVLVTADIFRVKQ
jgi:quercetin dioxygenase-like cupin family protein